MHFNWIYLFDYLWVLGSLLLAWLKMNRGMRTLRTRVYVKGLLFDLEPQLTINPFAHNCLNEYWANMISSKSEMRSWNTIGRNLYLPMTSESLTKRGGLKHAHVQ